MRLPGYTMVGDEAPWWWTAVWGALRRCCLGEKGEEESPLTGSEGDVPGPLPKAPKKQVFGSEGRQGSQPYLACPGRVAVTNPVPCITLDKWERPNAGAVPRVLNPHKRVKTVLRTKKEMTEGTTRTVVVRRRHQSDSDEDVSDCSRAASPPRSKAPPQDPDPAMAVSACSLASSSTEPGDEEKDPKAFLKAGSLASLFQRSESMLSLHSLSEGTYGTVGIQGDIEFGFIYNFGSGSLDMSIKQCRDLAPVDTKRNRSNTYVKVYLLPDRSKAGKRKTKVKKHTLNPVFEEIHRFLMPLKEVKQRTMWISVWHSDMFGRNDFLGEVMLPMSGQVFDTPSSQWYTLQDRDRQSW